MSERPTRATDDGQVWRRFRPGRLSASQRRRHLDRLAQAIAAEEDEMEFLKRRSRAELFVLAAALLVVLLGVVTWNVVLSDEDDGDEPEDLVVVAGATLTARAASPDPTATSTQPASTTVPAAWDGVCRPDSFATDLPVGVPRSDPSFPDWHGNEEAGLWVATVDRAGLSESMFKPVASRWFTGHMTFLMWYGSNEPLRVTGQQLGGDATFEVTETDFTNPQVDAQWTSFEIPEPGCWQITGQAGDKSLTIDVNVLPLDERPDVVFARRYSPAGLYPAPSTCPVTRWTGPESRFNHYVAQYWHDADGLTISAQGWLVANLSNYPLLPLLVYGDDVVKSLEVTARPLDGPDQDAVDVETAIRNDSRSVEHVFPESGCWELEFATATSAATIVVYVYPEECAATFEAGAVIAGCEPPS